MKLRKKRVSRAAAPDVVPEGVISEPLPRGAGRPPVKRNEIFDELRRLIVSGEFPAGGRLWTLREICRRFQASPTTVQSVLQDLTQSGFIYSKGPQGTFVHEKLPFLHRYAVVFFDHGEGEEIYFKAIRAEALRLKAEGRELDIVDLPREPLRTGAVFDLEKLVERRLYRGLLFSQAPDHLLGTGIVDVTGVGRLCFSHRTKFHKNVHSIAPGPMSVWLEYALAHVAGLGRKRVGLFMHNMRGGQFPYFTERVNALGMQTHRTWIHTVNHAEGNEASSITELLFSLPEERRPDVLLVADDNLTEPISQTLSECGVQIPVISHCNYPMLPTTHAAVTWLGYDIRAMLEGAIQLLEAEDVAEETTVKSISLTPCFEHEIVAGAADPAP